MMESRNAMDNRNTLGDFYIFDIGLNMKLDSITICTITYDGAKKKLLMTKSTYSKILKEIKGMNL